jgi:carboxyl-terminal processing protease
LFKGALGGMVRQLDPYSGFVDADQYQELLEDLDQEFGGIGIIVDVDPDSERLMVLSPLVGSPAYEAGLRAGDLIMAIDGEDTEGLNANDSVTLIRGPPDTIVTLTVQSPGEDASRQVKLRRAIIPIESVLGDQRRKDGSWKFVLQDDPRWGYIRLVSFGQKTGRDLEAALEQTLPHAQGLILDLRGNAGGLLDAAIDVCDLFLDEGAIVSIKGRNQRLIREFRATPGRRVPLDLPLVVLVDHFSASASEIVAACLQDYGRAGILGQRTWGKGTVQSVFELEGGRTALRLTTATYWRPSGKNIHRLSRSQTTDEWGVTPDEGWEIKLEQQEWLNVLRARRDRDVAFSRSGTDRPTDAAGPTAGAAGETSAAEPNPEDTPNEPVVDRQLQKAIEYLELQLSRPPARAA